MYKGDISNKFAPVLILDINLIYQVEKETLIGKIRNIIGKPKFKLKDKRIPKLLERWFYKDFSIYIVDRNRGREVRPESLIEGWCYSQYLRVENIEDMEALIDQTKVILAVFDRDYPALKVGKGKGINFISWQDLFERLG